MNIQDALKETGKARRSGELFTEVIEGSMNLKWSNGLGVSIQAILADDWQPYHEVKEIRPEKAGELWENIHGGRMFITERNGELYCTFTDHEECPLDKGHCVVHDGGTWTRLFPKPEDDSVERIEVEGVEWESNHLRDGNKKGRTVIFPEWEYLGWEEVEELLNKPPMKMILEIPKEDI